MSALPYDSSAAVNFSDLLERALHVWDQRQVDDGVFALALPLQGLDPLLQLSDLEDADPFRFLWDGAPGLSFAAAGRCHHLELSGPKRFELAQRFSDITLGRILDGSPEAPAQARSRILLAFSFFESTGELQPKGSMPSVQAVLPRWQLSRHGRQGWLRLHGVAQQTGDVLSLIHI